MKLWTSYFASRELKARRDLVRVAICTWCPKWPGAFEEVLESAQPSIAISQTHNAREYLRNYRHELEAGGSSRVIAELLAISNRHEGKDLVLLCYKRDEAQTQCHRFVLAQFLMEFGAGEILELPLAPLKPKRRQARDQLALPLEVTAT